MAVQTQVKKTAKKTSKTQDPGEETVKKESKTEHHDREIAEIDALLEEIDGILEIEEDFALNFKQAGGQ